MQMKKINTNGWKNFKIEDLFNKCELKCKKGNFNKAFDVSQVQTSEFTLPLVNQSTLITESCITAESLILNQKK